MEGVEPPHLSALGSKPSVSTSSTTSPERRRIILQNKEMLRSFSESILTKNKVSHFFSFDELKEERSLKITLPKKQKAQSN